MYCHKCSSSDLDKGRAFDGRRAYRCKQCGNVWTNGLQGRKRQYSQQREGYQFADSKGKNLTAKQTKHLTEL